MNLLFSLLFTASHFFASAEMPMHANVVAHVLIDNYHNDLYAEIYLEKTLFANALRHEADCDASLMLSKCGSEYVEKNLKMTLNGESVVFADQTMDIQKDYVIYRFYLGKAEDCITKVTVKTNYMFQYDEHAVTKLRIKIDEVEKHYSLITSRKEITFSKI